MSITVLDSIATGNPPLRKSQQEAAAFMARIEGLSAPLRNRIPQIYERSGIDYRYTCIDDYDREPEAFEFYPPNWRLAPAPSTRARNAHYRQAALPLAEDVARRALVDAGIAPADVTHVVAVSCTGFFAPGIDIELVKRLGLPAGTQRAIVGFMGCYAALNALRVAHGFCQSQPGARVLVVCVELCTLHFQVEDSLESIIVNSIFSDGAAAAVLSSRNRSAAQGRLSYVDNAALIDDDSMGDMTWDVGDTGFLMGLSARVPAVIARHLPAYVDGLLAKHGLKRTDVDFWGIHPGGRAIVEKAASALELPPEATHDSLEVLRLHGNMSSPTILFILQRFLQRHEAGTAGANGSTTGLAMAFGPGLTLEGALFREVR